MSCLLQGVALAQDGPDPAVPPEVPVGPRLPRVLTAVQATYPPDALAEGLNGNVLLEVAVSDTGEVLGAVPVESTDPRFEGPAVDALYGFVFSPALDSDGQPAGAVIRYRYAFVATAAPVLVVEGTLLEATGERRLERILVTATGPEEQKVFSTTDAEGAFRFSGLGPGTWRIEAGSGTRYLSKQLQVEVSEGQVRKVTMVLEEPLRAGVSDLEIEVIGQAASDQITERVLGAAEIEFLPGTGGDVVKAVQNLPGVARAPSGIGQLIIRGTPPEDSAFGLDGARIPIVFHFSGLTTVLSTEIVDEVGYLPGSYGVRYGRTLGGVVDLRIDDELPTQSRSVASVDVFQSQLFTEQKVGERTAITLAGRRSYIDAVLSPVLSKGDLTIQAPRYYDAQARVLHQTDGGDRLDAMFLLSDDRFRFVGKNADGEDETLASLVTTFQKLRLRWMNPLGEDLALESVLLLGPEKQYFEFQRDSEASEEMLSISLREELLQEVGEQWGYRVGLDLLCAQESYDYDVAFFPRGEQAQAAWCAPGPYGEVTARLGSLLVTPGVRADLLAVQDTTVSSVDPRLGLKWGLSGSTILRAGTGLYSQAPGFRELDGESDGNPDLVSERSWQTSLGVTQQLGNALSAEATAFYQPMTDLVVGREDRFEFFTGPPIRRDFDTGPYSNEGTGLVCGVETLVRYTDELTVAQLAATFSHSERTGRDGVTRLFEYDQPVILNALASRELPPSWRLGARVRYGSGNPYTPVVNRIYQLSDRAWIPVYDTGVTERLKPFFSLDVRVDREFDFERWDLTTYLDIQNVTYYRNVEVMAWSEDYSEEQPIEGLPPVPSFGLKGEW